MCFTNDFLKWKYTENLFRDTNQKLSYELFPSPNKKNLEVQSELENLFWKSFHFKWIRRSLKLKILDFI